MGEKNKTLFEGKMDFTDFNKKVGAHYPYATKEYEIDMRTWYFYTMTEKSPKYLVGYFDTSKGRGTVWGLPPLTQEEIMVDNMISAQDCEVI